MEGLRTRARKLAAAADALNHAPAAPFRLAFLTDPRGPDPDGVARALPSGAALILRHYGDTGRPGLARRLRAITAARGVLLVVGGDANLAQRVGADGVHWRADQLGRDAHRVTGLISTAACHSMSELVAAARAGGDAAFLSPVFATRSHPYSDYLGAARFCALAAASSIPVLALGGVDETNACALGAPNVAGFGAIGAFAAR